MSSKHDEEEKAKDLPEISTSSASGRPKGTRNVRFSPTASRRRYGFRDTLKGKKMELSRTRWGERRRNRPVTAPAYVNVNAIPAHEKDTSREQKDGDLLAENAKLRANIAHLRKSIKESSIPAPNVGGYMISEARANRKAAQIRRLITEKMRTQSKLSRATNRIAALESEMDKIRRSSRKREIFFQGELRKFRAKERSAAKTLRRQASGNRLRFAREHDHIDRDDRSTKKALMVATDSKRFCDGRTIKRAREIISQYCDAQILARFDQDILLSEKALKVAIASKQIHDRRTLKRAREIISQYCDAQTLATFDRETTNASPDEKDVGVSETESTEVKQTASGSGSIGLKSENIESYVREIERLRERVKRLEAKHAEAFSTQDSISASALASKAASSHDTTQNRDDDTSRRRLKAGGNSKENSRNQHRVSDSKEKSVIETLSSEEDRKKFEEHFQEAKQKLLESTARSMLQISVIAPSVTLHINNSEATRKVKGPFPTERVVSILRERVLPRYTSLYEELEEHRAPDGSDLDEWVEESLRAMYKRMIKYLKSFFDEHKATVKKISFDW
eukprot:g1196.t1